MEKEGNTIQCIPSLFSEWIFLNLRENYNSSYSTMAMADLTGELSSFPSARLLLALTQDPVSMTGKKHTHHVYQRKDLNVLFTPSALHCYENCSIFSFPPVPVTYYYTLFLRKSIFYYCHWKYESLGKKGTERVGCRRTFGGERWG